MYPNTDLLKACKLVIALHENGPNRDVPEWAVRLDPQAEKQIRTAVANAEAEERAPQGDLEADLRRIAALVHECSQFNDTRDEIETIARSAIPKVAALRAEHGPARPGTRPRSAEEEPAYVSRFRIEEGNDDQLYVDVAGVGTVAIEFTADGGLRADIFRLEVSDAPVATASASSAELWPSSQTEHEPAQ